jgi:hypothetical protein
MATEAIVRQVGECIADVIGCIHKPRCADGGYCGCREEAKVIIAIVEAPLVGRDALRHLA